MRVRELFAPNFIIQQSPTHSYNLILYLSHLKSPWGCVEPKSSLTVPQNLHRIRACIFLPLTKKAELGECRDHFPIPATNSVSHIKEIGKLVYNPATCTSW